MIHFYIFIYTQHIEILRSLFSDDRMTSFDVRRFLRGFETSTSSRAPMGPSQRFSKMVRSLHGAVPMRVVILGAYRIGCVQMSGLVNRDRVWIIYTDLVWRFAHLAHLCSSFLIFLSFSVSSATTLLQETQKDATGRNLFGTRPGRVRP